ncbi:MAG: hypothetical protein GX218_01815 [Clostridiaceae bacterium]|nr:hypothetical protein [Clostridiaceae bacterium]
MFAMDFLIYLYFKEVCIDPQNPDWLSCDRFILSKSHACSVLYATLDIALKNLSIFNVKSDRYKDRGKVKSMQIGSVRQLFC